MDKQHIVIIGAGFCGVSLASNIQRLAKKPVLISLVGTPEDYSLGKAYSTLNPSHLLNVVAGDMSAFPDLPDHFVQWLRHHPETALYFDQNNELPIQFVPRMLYGHYLQSLLATAKISTHSQAQLELIPREVTDLRVTDNGFDVYLNDIGFLHADQLVLASGNTPPNNLFPDVEHTNYIVNPWLYSEIEKIPSGASVLILGTGLTMVDVLLSLEDNGHEGSVTAISRRGLLPRAHARIAKPYMDIKNLPAGLLARLRFFRKELEKGFEWRSLISACRPIVQDLWKSLSNGDQRRFLRYLVPYWDAHRHRIAPQVAERIENFKNMRIIRGKVLDMVGSKEQIRARIKPYQREPFSQKFDYVINCTGPATSLRHLSSPLFRSLFNQGLIKEGPHGIGLEIDNRSHVIKENGEVHPNFYAMGSLCKGTLWEIIAVPDLRIQSHKLGEHLLTT